MSKQRRLNSPNSMQLLLNDEILFSIFEMKIAEFRSCCFVLMGLLNF